MTDRPTTEPRTAYTRARQFYNERNLPQPYYDLLDEVVAEAAQGAAPLPQATVDLFCEVAASGVVHQAEPPGIDYVTVQVDMDTWRGIQAWAAGLSEGAAPRAEGLDVPAIRESDDAIEALRHLFWIMERLDKQAGPPFSHDHMVKITAEAWLDLVRPAIEQVRARLTDQEDRHG